MAGNRTKAFQFHGQSPFFGSGASTSAFGRNNSPLIQKQSAMRIFTYIATRLLIIYAIGNMAVGKEPLEIPLSPSGPPAPMSVSKTYPFFVSAYDKREVRLVERKLKQETQTREFILGGGGDFAVERISFKEGKQQAKDRQLDAAETTKLTSRILSALERHHGLKLLNTLKMLADDKDLAWISKRDDAKDLLATVLILDALRSMHQIEQAGAGQPATRPEPKPEGSDKPQPESEGRSR